MKKGLIEFSQKKSLDVNYFPYKLNDNFMKILLKYKKEIMTVVTVKRYFVIF